MHWLDVVLHSEQPIWACVRVGCLLQRDFLRTAYLQYGKSAFEFAIRPELFPVGSINSGTAFVLSNAIYLNAPWKQEFDPEDTSPIDLILADGSTIEVEMMNQYEMSIEMSYQEGSTVVTIPYKGDDLSLTVV